MTSSVRTFALGRLALNLRAGSQQFHTHQRLHDVIEVVSLSDFKQRVMKSRVPVIVNFHADWCEPCHSLKPMLRKFVEDHMGSLHLAEIAVDEHADLLDVFEVTAVPAVLAISGGQVVDKFIGLISDKEINEFIQRFLKMVNDPSGAVK